MVSSDLPTCAKVMEEFVDANSDQFQKGWKKLEVQQWLKNHGLKVPDTKEELVARVENAKRVGVETVVERAARENEEITCTNQANLAKERKMSRSSVYF